MKRLFVPLMVMFASATFADAQGVTLFGEDNMSSNFGLHIGYVNKQWISDIDSRNYKENLWGEEDELLHGIQVGLSYTPSIAHSKVLGLYTGLFGEFYMSESKAMGYDEFTEFSLYVPLHLNVNIPVSRSVSLNLHGGLGLNYACHGGFTNDDAYRINYVWDDYYEDYVAERESYEVDHIDYGTNGWPKRLNAALELSAGVKIKNVIVSAGYSWGMTDHKFYNDVKGSETHQNKMSLSIGFLF